jgi:hypothetical protein
VLPARRFLRLNLQDKILLLRAAAWLVAARVALPLAGLARLEAAIALRAASSEHAPERIAWAVHVVARRFPGTRCLARSLALHALLRREGYRSELRLGVAHEPGSAVRAHAWVECAGLEFEAEGPGGCLPFARLVERAW